MNQYIENEEAYNAAIKAKIRRAVRAKFERENPDADDVISYLYSADSWSPFAKSLLERYDTQGGLSVGQMGAARTMMEKDRVRQAERAAARTAPATSGRHMGNVGQREVFTLTIRKVMVMDGMYGASYLHLCADAAGNAFVYKGTSELGNEGDTVTVKATVKEHGAYNGVAQTIINRPKVQEA